MDITLGTVATASASHCSVGVMDTETARMAVMKNVMLQTVVTNASGDKQKKKMTAVIILLI